MVAMASRVRECTLHTEHNPVTMIIPQKPRCDSLIPRVLYKTYIRSHGGETYKFSAEEAKEVKKWYKYRED
jgi:hypothetical protein